MRKRLIIYLAFFGFLLISSIKLNCLDFEFDIRVMDNPAPGYIRFEYGPKPSFFMMDNYGSILFHDSIKIPNSTFVKMLDNGLWVHPTPSGIKLYDEYMNLADTIPCPIGYDMDLHDILFLANGNYLLLCTENIPYDMSKVVNNGNPNAIVMSNVLIETDRTGTVYWLWRFFDHINITDATFDIGLDLAVVDLTHSNSLFEDTQGNIIISSRHLDEVTKVNRSTGNIMWRMGGSTCKNNQFTFMNDNQEGFVGFSHQHTASILPNGNLLLFDNGNLKDPPASRAVEYQIDEVNMTALKVWEYRLNPDEYNAAMGSAFRLDNGNTLINWSTNRITEVKPNNTLAFDLIINDNAGIYRCYKHITRMNAMTKTVNSTGNYNFNDNKDTTGINLNVTSLTGSGLFWIEKHNYAPPRAEFLDSCFSRILPYRWVFSSSSVSNIGGTVKLKLNSLTDNSNPSKLAIYKRNRETSGIFLELNTTYNALTGELSAPFTGLGEFIIGEIASLAIPELILPANNSKKVAVNGKYSWKRLFGASKYRIQVSTNRDFTNIVLDSTFNYLTEFSAESLMFFTNYYWRIKALNSKNTSEWSDFNSFRTEIKPPTLYIPVNETNNFNFAYALKWEKVNGADNYWIQIAKDENFTNIIYQSKNITLDSIKINSLDYNTKYYWRVMGYQSTDSSRWSYTSYFTTLLAPPQKRTPINNSINVYISGHYAWDFVSGADRYLIEVAQDSLFTNNVFSVDDIKTSSYYYSNLLYNTKYFWRIKAYSNTNSSEWSAVWNFTTVLSKPVLIYPPKNSNSVAINTNLIWESNDIAKYYKIQLSTNSDFSSILKQIDSVAANQCHISELPINSKIYWRIQSFNYNKQFSNWSDVWYFTTGTSNPVQTPVLVSPPNDSISNVKGYFTWKKSISAIKYHLQVSTESDFGSFIINAADRTDTSYRYTDLEYNQQYYWRVKALNLYDTSQWSEVWVLKTPKLKLIKLLDPENEALQEPLNGQLVWEEMPDITSYWVQLSTDINFNDLLLDQKDVKDIYINYSGLKQKKEYFWRVRYFKDSDTSNWSNVWSFSTSYPYQLLAPILNSPNDEHTAVPVVGKLDWSNVLNAKSYKLTISKEMDFDEVDIKQNDIKSLEYNYSDLAYNQQYFWKVAASNDNSDSPWSQTRSFLTELKTPYLAAPDDKITEQSVDGTLIWVEVDGAFNYYLQIALDSLFEKIEIDLPIIYEPVYRYRLSSNTTYYWKVKALNENNYSQWSEVKSFTTEPKTSVSDLINDNNLTIYPNPFSEIIYFNFFVDNPGQHKIEIYDMMGRKVKVIVQDYLNYGTQSFSWNGKEENYDKVPNGQYLVKILNSKGTITKTFIYLK